jgi:hypothetical protein
LIVSIFWLEWFGQKVLHTDKSFLLPLPILLAYFLISLLPNFIWISLDYTGHWFRIDPQFCDPIYHNFWLEHCFLRYNLIWFILTAYALYAVLYYKYKLLDVLNRLKAKNVINDDTYYRAQSSLISSKRFLTFLAIFEIFFYLWWAPDDLPGIFIALVILPIGAQIFSAFTAGALLPKFLTKGPLAINIFDSDRRGGLKAISDLLITLSSIYFFGLLISFILYPRLYTVPSEFPFYGLFFILIGVFIFFFPQLHVHRILLERKTILLDNIHQKISSIISQIIQTKGFEKKSDDEDLANYLSQFQNIRDETNRMETWTFDWNIIKFIVSFSLALIIPLTKLIDPSHAALSIDDIVNTIKNIIS